jgi:5-methylcytosine-specific restriction endonuclease McrA
MKYELEPDNHNCSDETLLDDLRSVASRLGKTTLTGDEYSAEGRFHSTTIRRRFGSWNAGLRKAGLDLAGRIGVPDRELLDDIKRVSLHFGSAVLTREAYDSLGTFSSCCIVRRFGSWAKALGHIGLRQSPNWHPKIAHEDLFRNLAAVWEAIGRQPRGSDMCSPISQFSIDTYKRRFGSWRKALEAFVVAANDPTVDSNSPIDEPTSAIRSQNAPSKRTTRQPGWKLRFLVNRRDRFTCRACGRSPATNSGTQLHLDHVTPWSKGGETTFNNLQTLCQICNIGKSTLTMYEDGVKVT